MKKIIMTVGGLTLFTVLFTSSIIFAGASVRGERYDEGQQNNSAQNGNKNKKEKKPKKNKNSNSMDSNMMMNSTPTNDANVMGMNATNVEVDANMMMNSNVQIDANMMNANVFTDANMMNMNAPVVVNNNTPIKR